MKKQDILNLLIQNQQELKQHGVDSLSLFGSVARGDEKETSDIDVLVSFNKPVGLFAFMELKDHLEKLLRIPVDLVTEQALHPRLHDRIIKESIHVI